ncbi:hypothetical protein E4U27_003868 [Claviceps purpurea]|nr:hypothetical protein E4U27_003868 [Claviceps purpurea]
MPSKERSVDVDPGTDEAAHDKHRRSKSERKPERERERDRDRDRDKDRDRERHRDRERDKDKVRDKDRDRDREHRHRSSKISLLSKLGVESSEASSRRHHKKDKDRESERERDRHKRRDPHKDKDNSREKHGALSDLTEDMSKVSLDNQRISLPYPTFSKAHSKEAVVSRDDLSDRQQPTSLTPDPTDIGGDEEKRSSSAKLRRSSSTSRSGHGPPTPPATDLPADKKRGSDDKRVSDVHRAKSSASGGVSRSASLRHDETSKVSRRSGSSSQATYVKSRDHKVHEKLRSSGSVRSSSSRHSVKRSDSARSRSKKVDLQDCGSSPSSVQDSSPQTPTQTARFLPHIYEGSKNKSAGSDIADREFIVRPKTAMSASTTGPSPPPPPPPAVDVHDAPRVDYLLQNGGLSYPVARSFLSVLPAPNGARPLNPPLAGADTLFSPFFNLLDQYSNVLSKQGSIAVATGHRSVARRLLDRLENVFSRDLPPHGCSCVMCDQSHEIHKGLTWGDVLEWVSGRIELPPWPPFDLAEMGLKAAEVSAEVPPRPASPVKMDPDIAEEFREHYLRQSKKVRSAVDKWLTSTGENPVPPPQDVDDETLAFAILTNMDAENRPFFNALLAGTRDVKSAMRAPTPLHRPRNDFIIKSGLSLQRLYRLQQAPRDGESASYLVKNPHTHDLLVTISNINSSEWEILTSGRFDGFLWSGADADDMLSGMEMRGETPFGRRPSTSSRTSAPFSPYSRGATPASFISLTSSGTLGASRQPVSNDEEMEMAAIAEIEREIYTGMESLEDAFEKLHQKAESIRTALRRRGAGLMQNLQSRRRIDVLPTPVSGNSQHSGYERPPWAAGSDAEVPSDDDWGLDDMDIMPDDSASNISSSRHRRPKRRTERRTPAPIEEDDEE